MLVKISTEKINPTTGRVTVKYASNNENFCVLSVTHYLDVFYNNRRYIFTIGDSCCVYYATKCQGGGEYEYCPQMPAITCGPEKIIDI